MLIKSICLSQHLTLESLSPETLLNPDILPVIIFKLTTIQQKMQEEIKVYEILCVHKFNNLHYFHYEKNILENVVSL